ncbi:glycosyltransferase family 4 protein [Thalassotalea mangrovi]|uniref:Glycosyltransferase family 4 protein n=1 Tax=Thalassotalea mangrovi TaxID=2572245 RepID=A0A4U1B873_9GAMM|nr:glycosyltransferase family 4 protein [Thalassotalea mangrovi]TKB46143.1 glycosyltransferase family 4 protein [Thalassotalea mangrovi]
MNKILYIVSGRSFHGHSLGRKISEVINCWRKEKVDVDVICGADIFNNKSFQSADYGAQTHFDKSYRNKAWLSAVVISVSELKDIIHDFKLFFHIRTRAVNSQLIWERSSRLHISSLFYSKARNIPYVLEWKDNLVNYRFSLFKPLALMTEWLKEKLSDYIVVESHVLKSRLTSRGIDPNKIVVAHNAVDVSEFVLSNQRKSKIRDQLQLNNDDIIIGYLGSYAFYHNPQLLIEAANETKNQNRLKYVLIGNGKYYRECIELAEKYKIINRTVYFLDGVPKEEVPLLIQDMDITVLPGSTDIICPIKIFEYMAMEKPVVLPDYSCNREVVKDKEDALLFKPFDCNDLVAKLVLLASDKTLRAQLSKNARASVRQEYNWSNTWGSALLKILGGLSQNSVTKL